MTRNSVGVSRSFANLVIDARTQLGWSQSELGDRLGVGQQTVHRWEKGSEPDRQKLPEIIAVLGLDRDEVLRGLGFEELFAERPPEETENATLDAIRRDTRLLPEARAHLLNQYQLLLRVGQQDADESPVPLKRVARKNRRT